MQGGGGGGGGGGDQKRGYVLKERSDGKEKEKYLGSIAKEEEGETNLARS